MIYAWSALIEIMMAIGIGKIIALSRQINQEEKKIMDNSDTQPLGTIHHVPFPPRAPQIQPAPSSGPVLSHRGEKNSWPGVVAYGLTLAFISFIVGIVAGIFG